MEPGQVALQLGTWLGSLDGGVEAQGILGVEVPFSHRVAAVAWAGVQRHADDSFDPRDGTVAALWFPVLRDDLVVRLQPGLSIPTGGIGSSLYFTPRSSASVDPWIAGDVIVGAAWLGSASVVARVPVYDGWDRIRQGPFLRADVRAARRLGVAVPFVGASVVRQAPSAPVGAAPDFAEVAATAGSVVNLTDRWSLTAQLRVPAWVSDGAVRQVSGGLSARWVVGKPPEGHEH